MIKLQPWRAVKALFGYSTGGSKRKLVSPRGLKNLALNIYAYGKDPISTWYARKIHLTQDRLQAYKEFDDADSSDIICAVLDLYAEDACSQASDTNKRIWAEAEDEDVENLCNDLLDRVNADEQCFPIAREISKYGNSFSAVIQQQKDDGTPGQVSQLLAAPVYALSRIEDEEGRLNGFVVAPIERMGHAIGMAQPSDLTQGKPTDPAWSFIHFRLLGRDRVGSYGTSLLWAARRSYRRLRMCEDALTLYRLKRSPDRFVFKIKGLAGMSPEDRASAMRKIRQELRKKHAIDPDTGQARQEYEPLGVDEDLIVDDESVAVERLTGSAQVNYVLDIDYLRKRFLGSLKIPADYMGFSDAKSGFMAESPLSYQDINFSRVIKRVQYSTMQGFGLACQINMCWLGIDPRSEKSKFTLHMSPVSALDEKHRLEIERVRADTLDTLQRVGASLGLESDEWQAYLLQRSRIPTHLLRVKKGDKGGLLKGKVAVQENIQKIIETRHDLVESIDKKIKESKNLNEVITAKFFKIVDGHINIKKFSTINKEGKPQIVEIESTILIKDLFDSSGGFNTFQSKATVNYYDEAQLPLSNLNKTNKQLTEAAVVTEWKSEANQTELKKTKNLMEETIKTLKEDHKKDVEHQKKLAEAEEKFGLSIDELEEFELDEEKEE